MTPEEKAKAYDEALRKMRPLYEQAKKQDCPIWSTYEYIFPELRESEDKWFIKELQGFLESYGADYFGTGEWQKFHDWLEKHNEQKPAEWSEEDEDFINMLILHFNYLIDKGGDSVETYKSYIEKLKSLRPHWKPSEEQMEALDTVLGHEAEKVGSSKALEKACALSEQLKKLK